MKNGITILLLTTIALATLVGCKKKTEPAPAVKMDMSKTAEQDADQAKQTAADAKKAGEAAVAAVTEQTKCPLLPNNPIDKKVFVEYKGKKVYFCCEDCKAAFNKDPEKYVKDLPQFKQ
jgi:YHS domain-containing protein